MAVSLLFKKTRAKLGTLELDASVSESHSSSVEVTRHPVEQGAKITDHRLENPDELTITGVISETPLPTSDVSTELRTSEGRQYQGRGQAAAGRVASAYQELLELKASETLLTVVTALRTYENMCLTSLEVPRDAKTGRALRFTAKLTQVRVVQNKTVQVQAKTTRAVPKADLNKKVTPPADQATKTKSKSFLKYAKDGIGKLFGGGDTPSDSAFAKNPLASLGGK